MARLIFAVGVLLTIGTLLGADEPVPGPPKEIKQAEQTLSKWLATLKNQPVKDVRKALGPPTKEDSWLFEETKQPLLHYKIGDGGSLRLYVYKDRLSKWLSALICRLDGPRRLGRFTDVGTLVARTGS